MAVRRGSADANMSTTPRWTRAASIASLLNIELPDWHKDAVCAQTDPETFFPSKGGSTRDAKKMCTGDGTAAHPECPARERCLAWALAGDERHGIWGGFSERERRKLKLPKPPKVAPCPAA